MCSNCKDPRWKHPHEVKADLDAPEQDPDLVEEPIEVIYRRAPGKKGAQYCGSKRGMDHTSVKIIPAHSWRKECCFNPMWDRETKKMVNTWWCAHAVVCSRCSKVLVSPPFLRDGSEFCPDYDKALVPA